MIVFDQQSIRKKIRTVTSMDMGSNAVSNELIILCCTKIGHIAYDILGLITGELYRDLLNRSRNPDSNF